MNSSTTKGLRFAALVRVSTEGQEKHGESLHTQRKQITSAAHLLGGTTSGWYGGAEHATPGHEKRELDRLMADAAKGKFDAVMVANADRWSRDPASESRLDVFRWHGVRFFVGPTEYDLHDPEHCLFLGMSAVFGRFQAHQQNKKSLLNRIERARKGLPSCGKLPFGRTFTRTGSDTGTWAVDPDAQALVEEVARRYLAGESMAALAKEFGRNHSYLHKVLTRGCGPAWEQEFRSDALKIREVVQTPVPALLPEETILAVRAKVEANKTFTHGSPKHRYLLNRMVFCGHCGYALNAETNLRGHRYYRHTCRHRDRACPRARAWARCDALDEAVLWQLFDLFGNPAAVQRAVAEATPNRERIEDLVRRRERLAGALEKNAANRKKIVNLLCKDALTEEQAEANLKELKDEEEGYKTELDALDNELANVPDAAQVKAAAERCAAAFGRIRYGNARLDAKRMLANTQFEDMTWEDKRHLVETVFAGKTPDGRRLGVYVEWPAGPPARRLKRWDFRIRGRLIDATGTAPCPAPEEPGGGPLQAELLDGAAGRAEHKLDMPGMGQVQPFQGRPRRGQRAGIPGAGQVGVEVERRGVGGHLPCFSVIRRQRLAAGPGPAATIKT